MTKTDYCVAQAQLGLDNRQLATLLGVSMSTISKRRRGAININKEAELAMRHLLAHKEKLK